MRPPTDWPTGWSGRVCPDVVVGVALERSLSLVVAVLAVLKAGGAYLPLDPANPEARLRFMVTDAGASVLVTADEVPVDLTDLFATVIKPSTRIPSSLLALPTVPPTPGPPPTTWPT